MKTISNIKFYRTNAEVFIDRNDGITYGDDSVMFSWDKVEEGFPADMVAGFINRLSLRIRKNTFIVLNNANVHR